MNAMDSWSIAVKTVGGPSSPDVRDFIVNVSPDDDLTSLHSQIEEFTGLKASQQRLIYRGRIIKGGTCNESIKKEPRVKDVVGLADGQTIHLVPRPESEPVPDAPVLLERSLSESAVASPTPPSRSNDGDSSSSGTASLLAALLGLGSMDDDAEEPLGQQLARLRSARIRNRSRRPNHRLSASDLEVPDPGTMEPVRQGLMTLHTMLEDRRWYRGQWIDCRDTVNQWLEATIVEIVTPDEILPSHLQSEAKTNISARNGSRHPTTDPAVSATDMEGRLRLLLEPSDGCDGETYRERDHNEGVHLLLIHYNAWPHRWDEWIRSDSERIRPFRTRSRHPNTSSTACPTPQSHFNASPSTNIRSEDEPTERAALLPELQRVFHVVNTMLDQTLEKGKENVEEEHLRNVPWMSGGVVDDDMDDLPPLLSNSGADGGETAPLIGPNVESAASPAPTKDDLQMIALKKKLQTLVPLLDRLGRTLTDAAPHVASYAASLPDEPAIEPERVAPGESNVVIAEEEEEPSPEPSDRHSTIGGLFSLLPVGGRSAPPPAVTPEPAEDEELVEPDYVDFVNGVVNTTRGEVRTRGGRSSSSDDGAGLLGAYLAAASLGSAANDDDGDGSGGGLQGLGRLIRQREANGGGGGGIDIHIHAIVTGPAVGGGGLGGLAMLGDPQIATPRPTLFSTNSRRGGITEPRIPLSAPVDEEELGIFSDLYSETPTPVDLQNGVLPAEGRGRTGSIGSGPFDDLADLESIASVVSRRSRNSSIERARSPGRRRSDANADRRGGPVSRLIRRLSRRRSGFDRAAHDPDSA